MTDDLISALSGNLKVVRRGALDRRIMLGLCVALVISAVTMLAWLGLRADLVQAVGTPVFWVKFGYGAALVVAGYFLVRGLAQPGVSPRRAFVTTGVIFGAVVVLGVLQIVLAPPEMHTTLIIGSSAFWCPIYIIALSVPFLAVNMVVMRRFAPTNLPMAGLAAGILAGAAGAWVYAFHCGEEGLPFLAIWYTLGIVLVGIIGLTFGRLLLRW